MQRAAVNWTREQSRVIVSRGKNLLVSAAAGSGKTAVLVERIIRMVTEGKVTAFTGEEVSIQADSICVHGDNPSAVEFVKNIRAALTAQGVAIAPIAEIV